MSLMEGLHEHEMVHQMMKYEMNLDNQNEKSDDLVLHFDLKQDFQSAILHHHLLVKGQHVQDQNIVPDHF